MRWFYLGAAVIGGALLFLATGPLGGDSVLLQEEPRPAQDSPAQASARPSGNITFAMASAGPGNIYMWGVRKGEVSLPVEVQEAGNWSMVANNFEENASVANVFWEDIGRVLAEHPDAHILPYQMNIPDRFFGIYVQNDSAIRNPEDLHGKTIGAPIKLLGANIATRVVLRHEYGITTNWTDRWTIGEEAKDAIRDEDIDAVWMPGEKRIGDNHSLRAVFFPFQELEQKFGYAGLPTFFVVKDDPAAIDAGFELMEALQTSASHAQSQPDEFKHAYTFCNEFLVDINRTQQIEPVTPIFLEQAQYFLDAAHVHGFVNHDVNLSAHIIRRD